MSVKIPSSRNMLTEIQNLENLKGSNLSYGLTQILTNSNEFADISPVWDWTRLPGTTTPMGTLFMPPNNTDWRVPGTNPFAGGASDGKNGVMAFTSTYQGVTSTKGYFMLGNAMVCIGSGITSTNSSGIVTSVNQSLSYGTVTLNNGGTQSLFTAAQSTYNNTLNWVHHYNVGYYFPTQTANIIVKNDNQSGSWYDVNRSTSASAIVTSKMFSIWFDHGVQPTEAAPASYQYIVVPSVTATAFASWVATNPYTVVSNTKDIQCVKNSTLDMYGIVFCTAGTITLDNGLSVKSDKAAIVILSGKVLTGGTLKVSVADPMYIANNVITLEIKKQNGGTPSGKILTVAMPTGNYLGSTATTEFSFNEILIVNDHFASLVKVYPNPSTDTFTLTADENISTMKVTDLSGKTIEMIEENYLSGTKIQVGKNWKSGCYMLTLINESGKKGVIKLIKE
jgi:chondroitin AC lyase